MGGTNTPPICGKDDDPPLSNKDNDYYLLGTQLDGNNTILSNSTSNDDCSPTRVPHNIDRITCAVNLPTIATYNCRSLFPKLGNIKTDIIERTIDVAFLCEIWEKKENKNHQNQIETLLETEGLRYISTQGLLVGVGLESLLTRVGFH